MRPNVGDTLLVIRESSPPIPLAVSVARHGQHRGTRLLLASIAWRPVPVGRDSFFASSRIQGPRLNADHFCNQTTS